MRHFAQNYKKDKKNKFWVYRHFNVPHTTFLNFMRGPVSYVTYTIQLQRRNTQPVRSQRKLTYIRTTVERNDLMPSLHELFLLQCELQSASNGRVDTERVETKSNRRRIS